MKTTYAANIIEDSVNRNGNRLTTFEVTFPRFILAEVNTHKVLSKNSASSRAVPTWKFIQVALEDPFIPIAFTTNKAGMQGGAALAGKAHEAAVTQWLWGRDRAVQTAVALCGGLVAVHEAGEKHWPDMHNVLRDLYDRSGDRVPYPHVSQGIHKQYANRVLEPYLWHTAVISGTEWENFFGLRNHADAQPEFARVARMMEDQWNILYPTSAWSGDMHLPYITYKERQSMPEHLLVKVSVARCTRVSTTNQGVFKDFSDDEKLYDDGIRRGHLSPYEHVAFAMPKRKGSKWSGNFRGWKQLRKTLKYEDNFRQYLEMRP